jgi:hypothetical protein
VEANGRRQQLRGAAMPSVYRRRIVRLPEAVA